MKALALIKAGVIGSKIASASSKQAAHKATAGAIPAAGYYEARMTPKEAQAEAVKRLPAIFKGYKPKSEDWLVSPDQTRVGYQNSQFWLEITLIRSDEPKPARQAKPVGYFVTKLKVEKAAEAVKASTKPNTTHYKPEGGKRRLTACGAASTKFTATVNSVEKFKSLPVALRCINCEGSLGITRWLPAKLTDCQA